MYDDFKIGEGVKIAYATCEQDENNEFLKKHIWIHGIVIDTHGSSGIVVLHLSPTSGYFIKTVLRTDSDRIRKL